MPGVSGIYTFWESYLSPPPGLCSLRLPLFSVFFTFYYTMPQVVLNPHSKPFLCFLPSSMIGMVSRRHVGRSIRGKPRLLLKHRAIVCQTFTLTLALLSRCPAALFCPASLFVVHISAGQFLRCSPRGLPVWGGAMGYHPPPI